MPLNKKLKDIYLSAAASASVPALELSPMQQESQQTEFFRLPQIFLFAIPVHQV